MDRLRRTLVVILVAACSAGCDQATKWVAGNALSHRPPIALFGDTLRLLYIENPGAFLSLGAGLPGASRRLFFGIGALIVLALIAAHTVLRRSTTRIQLVSIAAIAGGGAGNIIDRFTHGAVRDFLNVGVGPVRTGIFNAADMIIMAGMGLLLWDGWRSRRRRARNP